nr:diguanylate cyclase [uncultured Sulfurimonas sp.]
MIFLKNIQKHLLLVIALFVFVFSVIFALLLTQRDSEIDEVLHEQLRFLEISYKQALDRFEVISKNVYISLQNDDKFLDILSKSVDAKKEQKEILRKALHKHLKDEFEKLKSLEIRYLQIVLPNNKSFLRVHKPTKFGDDLTNIRHSVKYANSYNSSISGFEQGKTSHAFRHVYPIYKNAKHIGVVDIGFSSTMLQNYTMRASDIHTHFIVNKNVFDSQAWKGNKEEPYHQSIEHKDFMFSMSDHIDHKRLDESQATLIFPIAEQINKNIATGKEFSLYKEIDSKIRVLAFLPIKNVKGDKTVAYLVSYTDSKRISTIKEKFEIYIILNFVILSLIFIFVYKILSNSEILKKELQYDGLTGVFNRKYFIKTVEDEFIKSKRLKHDFCIVMADIDHFKNINDTYGHQCGDIVLRDISYLMSTSIRSVDMLGRYGGEEFIFLISANAENTYKVVQNVRKKIEKFDFCNEKHLKLTASFGIACLKDEDTLEELIKYADMALYKSKNSGRNRITI